MGESMNSKYVTLIRNANAALLALSACMVLISCRQVGPVSAQQNTEAMNGGSSLPTDGDSIADDAIHSDSPYKGGLLGISETDVAEDDLASYAMIIVALCDEDDYQDFVVRRFGQIQHHKLKLYLGALLFEKGVRPDSVVRFMRNAIDEPASASELAEFIGEEYNEFKSRVKSAAH
jgi:hypothetical protein